MLTATNNSLPASFGALLSQAGSTLWHGRHQLAPNVNSTHVRAEPIAVSR
jgi:hypothetical protein